jgi:hypothetical protein
MHSSGEEQSFARCARAPCWLHKSVSGVRSREAMPVAAGEADGDLARGQEPRAKRHRERSPGGNTWRKAKGPRRVAFWLQTLGVVEPRAFHEATVKAMLVGRQARRQSGQPAGDESVRSRPLRRVLGVRSTQPRPGSVGGSEAKAVKRRPHRPALSRSIATRSLGARL